MNLTDEVLRRAKLVTDALAANRAPLSDADAEFLCLYIQSLEKKVLSEVRLGRARDYSQPKPIASWLIWNGLRTKKGRWLQSVQEYMDRETGKITRKAVWVGPKGKNKARRFSTLDQCEDKLASYRAAGVLFIGPLCKPDFVA